MSPDEDVLFELFLNSGPRKREVMFLEDEDLIVETLAPGLVKRQIRVTSKHRLGFITKNGKTRFVPVERDLMTKLLALKATERPSKLLFGTPRVCPTTTCWTLCTQLRSVQRRIRFRRGTLELLVGDCFWFVRLDQFFLADERDVCLNALAVILSEPTHNLMCPIDGVILNLS
jgi:hypothetical protein